MLVKIVFKVNSQTAKDPVVYAASASYQKLIRKVVATARPEDMEKRAFVKTVRTGSSAMKVNRS